MAAAKDLIIEQGKTFSQVLRWEAPPIIYAPITGITQTAPVRITAPLHDCPPGWRVAVVSVKGMSQINAQNSPPKASDYHSATVIDQNTVELNDVNAADFKAYVSGGYLQFNTPVDLTGYSARMSIKDKIGGTELMSLTSASEIDVDAVGATITINITATVTASLGWKKGVYDLELISAVGVVTALLAGTISVTREVTT